ncbi:hypothetical protein FJT64_020616 [Amphibalanus amphitrite]|uniref:Uncharacterized protein n=1 Tax=Amphibalanus amphitrite TaxID=1232801 RepID=A0A6A4X031_AMPAM|nr:hypothetical protein FJT64_020616 [Amphibalanus amphitrite]
MDFSVAPAPFLPAAGAEPGTAWPRWIRMFDNFLVAVGGGSFSAARKEAILLTCLGAEGQRIFESLPAAVKQEGEDQYAFTRRRLEAQFAPRQNVCVERYRFRSRVQQTEETVQQWVSILRQLASSCEYGDRTDEFIRDQVIERTNSSKLRQRLLMEGSDLTLERTLTISDTLESAERTGETPFRLMRGREARTLLDVVPGEVSSPDTGGELRARHEKYQAAYKARYDRGSTGAPRWRVGDWVRVRQPVSGRVEGQRAVQISRRTGPMRSYVSVIGSGRRQIVVTPMTERPPSSRARPGADISGPSGLISSLIGGCRWHQPITWCLVRLAAISTTTRCTSTIGDSCLLLAATDTDKAG